MRNAGRSGSGRKVIRAAIILLAALAVLAAGIMLLEGPEAKETKDIRQDGTREFMDESLVEWNGGQYIKKPATRVYLIVGIDQEQAENRISRNSYRNGGQADFLLLLAIDHTEQTVHMLQIDRDTMTDVTILGTYGNETGTRVLQICLSHSFGADREENAKYTLQAVGRLLEGIDIDGYYMVNYSAVGALNDALGGVTVTIPEDMTSVMPEWEAGKTVTLHGTEAETFVRTRRTVGGGTNRERAARQQIYIRGAINRIRELFSEDTGAGPAVLAALRRYANTNLTDQKLLTEINDAMHYSILPVDTLEGEYTHDADGFVEFHMTEHDAARWKMDHLYQKR